MHMVTSIFGPIILLISLSMFPAIRMIGEVYVEKGEFSKGLKYSEKYRRLVTELQDPVLEQRALATIGWTYYSMAMAGDRGMLERALKYFMKCLSAVAKIPTSSLEKKERQEMKGRAMENIGNTHFMLDQREKAVEKFQSAELYYRESRLWADLHRLANTRANQILEAGGSPSSSDLATALAQANTALEAGQRVGAEAEVESLCTMFKVYLVQREFTDARSCLSKARRLQAGDMGKFIDTNLKMSHAIDDELVKISSVEGLASHIHYEKIADALLNYESSGNERNKVLEISVVYYKKAFERAKVEGSTEKLPSLNNSIAKTYEDLQNYVKALDYFKDQLVLDKDNPEDYCIALSNTAMMKESLCHSYEEVMELRREWHDKAARADNRSQQLVALKEMYRHQREAGRLSEARDTQARLEELGGSVEERENSSQSSQSSQLSDKFPDIDLADREEQSVDRTRIAKRTPAEYTKGNKKGEFPLHLEIQRAGQENKIISMIERGHPLEVKDNAGWTPLGEATGHMNISYVRILVEAGANINARNNNGETPLVVAAERGWLDGIEFYLDRGAKVDLKSNKGNTCLSFLNGHVEEGRKGVLRDYKQPGVMDRLEAATARVEKIYENLGLSTDVPLPLESDSPSLEDDIYLSDLTLVAEEPLCTNSTQKRRRSPSPCSSPRSSSPLSDPSTRQSSPVPGRRMYQEAMQSLRSSAAMATLPRAAPRTSTQRGAEEYCEDWLVEDVRTDKRKRRRQSLVDDWTSSASNRRSLDVENVEPLPPIDLTTSPVLKSSSSYKLIKSKKKSSKQPLISSLITRSRTPSPLSVSAPSSPLRQETEDRLQLPPVQVQPSVSSVLRVKVSVSGEMFLVPVPDCSLTVGWLASEAAARYYRQLGTEPVLRLRTSDGAVLDTGDLVAHIFQPGDQLTADVMQWKTKPGAEMYDDACKELGLTNFKNIRARLVNMSTTNCLSLRLSLKYHHVQPLFRSLRGNCGLRELELTHCRLRDEQVELLGEVLPSVTHLSSLNLSYNLLTSRSLKLLSTLGLKVKQLELSGNMLDDDCLPSLTSLLSSYSNLQTLSIARCSLTKMLFQSGRGLFSLEAKKSKLKHLDISHNELTASGVEILVSCLPAGLVSLDISNCNHRKISSPGTLGSAFLSHCSQSSELSRLKMSMFSLDNRSLAALETCLAHWKGLTELDLSHNLLTSQALLALLAAVKQHKVPLLRLRLAVADQEEAERFWSDKGQEQVAQELQSLLASKLSVLELLELPHSSLSSRAISQLWDMRHGASSLHCRDLGNVVLSVQ